MEEGTRENRSQSFQGKIPDDLNANSNDENENSKEHTNEDSTERRSRDR
jgi:hypothetical protein